MKYLILAVIALCLLNSVSAAIIKGNVYEWFSLEPLNKVIIEVNSTPHQKFVSKDGEYSFTLDKGHYLIEAKYYEDNSLKYSTDETIHIADDGEYIVDLIMFPQLDNETDEILETELEEIGNRDELIDLDENKNEKLETPIYEKPISEEKLDKSESEKNKNNLIPLIAGIIGTVLIVLFVLTKKQKPAEKFSTNIEPEIEEITKTKLEKEQEEFVDFLHGEESKVEEKPNEKSTKEELKEEDKNGKKELKEDQTEEEKLKEIEKLDKYALEVIDILKRSGNRLTQKELREKSSVGEAKISLIISELEELGKIKKIKKGRGNIIVLKENQ